MSDLSDNDDTISLYICITYILVTVMSMAVQGCVLISDVGSFHNLKQL